MAIFEHQFPCFRIPEHRVRVVRNPGGMRDNSPAFQCAVNTEQDSRGRENPTRQLSLRRKQSGRVSLATAAGEAPDVKGSCKRVSERAGPNMSEHRASLEKGNANADPV